MSEGKRMGGWSFEPDWLIGGGDKDHAVLEELSTCPSWLTLENTRHQNSSSLNLTTNVVAKRIDALADPNAMALAKANSDRVGHALREARNQISVLQAELHQREALTRHTKAQNLVLRSELAGFKKNVADLNNELKDLHDHVHFLRHITAPTPDAGALDASLAMLRGHELEQARSREKETRAALCTSETAREQIQMDLENERQNRNAAETSYQAEIDRLNLEISRFSALHSSREHRNATDEARHRDMLAHQERHLASVKEDMRREAQRAVDEEAKKWRQEVERQSERHQELTAEIAKLKETIDDLGETNREQADQLDLAYAEIDGRGLRDPRRDEGRDNVDRELSRQRDKLLADFARERTELKRELAQLRQLGVAPATPAAEAPTTPEGPSTPVRDSPSRLDEGFHVEKGAHGKQTREIGVNTGKDPLLERLGAYHTQLQLATDELSRASEDNKYLFGKLVAAFCAMEALHRTDRLAQDGATSTSRPHADAHVDPAVAHDLHAHIKELEQNQDKLGTLAEMWEEQANELEATLAERERAAVNHAAALEVAQRNLDKLRGQLETTQREFEERIKTQRTHLEHKLDQAGDALERSARRIEDQEHRLGALQSQNEDLERAKSVLEADLAIAENEVIRLRTELARKKMELSRAERSRSHAATQTDPASVLVSRGDDGGGMTGDAHSAAAITADASSGAFTLDQLRRERKRWEAEKNRELKAMQKKFASSFKKQVAKVIGARPELPRNEALEMSLVSIDSADPLEGGNGAATAHQHFNVQDCTPPVTSLDANVPAPSLRGGVWMPDSLRRGRELPTIPRSLLSEARQASGAQHAKENATATAANRRWDPEESYARWKKQQERKKATVAAAATTAMQTANLPSAPAAKTKEAQSRLPLRPTSHATPLRSAKSRAATQDSSATRIKKPSSASSYTSTTPSSAAKRTASAFTSATTPTLSVRVANASRYPTASSRTPPSPPPHISRRKPARMPSTTTTTPSTVSPPSARRRPAFR